MDMPAIGSRVQNIATQQIYTVVGAENVRTRTCYGDEIDMVYKLLADNGETEYVREDYLHQFTQA